ncbi:AMP-binding protein [Streptomyces sp. NPDC021212]|uniref:AMP-binding protein n=1 Tax=Streptomyces sp. NPDC021212 TaxID=3365118 RepID=UPI0037B84D1C
MPFRELPSPLRAVSDDQVRRVVRRHLHPENGSPFWLERDRELKANAYEKVTGVAEAVRLVGLQDAADQQHYEEAVRRRPVEDFIPRDVLAKEKFLWAAQTGGTTGPPKHGTWGSSYWRDVLEWSDYFLDLHGVPRDQNWLFLGPMGPHTTGRLVVSYAERRGGRCFSIDLDPRIVKVFGEEGMSAAADRYVRHIWDQTEAIIRSQDIGVMFCTSRLLEMLPEHLDPSLFAGVKAIVHAGTTLEPETHRILREDLFPGVPVVGLYGSSTTSVSWQKPFEPEDDYRVIYVPSSPHVLLEVVDEQGVEVDFGQEGWVRVWRFTEDQLIPGFRERDRARRVRPYGSAAEAHPWAWVGDPYSPEFTELGRTEGVY